MCVIDKSAKHTLKNGFIECDERGWGQVTTSLCEKPSVVNDSLTSGSWQRRDKGGMQIRLKANNVDSTEEKEPQDGSGFGENCKQGEKKGGSEQTSRTFLRTTSLHRKVSIKKHKLTL